MGLVFTRAMPKARPAGYFLDGLFDLMITSEDLEAIWRSVLPTSAAPEPSSIERFESLWEQHAESWDSDPQYMHESDGSSADPRNMSFYLLLQDQNDASDQLELHRQLAVAVCDWQDAALHMEGRAPCILPWLETSRGTKTLYHRLLSVMRKMDEAVAKPAPSGLPISGDLDAYAIQAAVVRVLVDEVIKLPMFAERHNEVAVTPPSKLPPRSLEALILLWRTGTQGMSREEMGAMFSGRSVDSIDNVNFADGHIGKLRHLHGYPITDPPWRVEADKLPASYRRHLDNLVSRDSLEIDPKHD